jgi:hypothetical protein
VTKRIMECGAIIAKIFTVALIVWAAYSIDSGGKMLADVQLSVNAIKSSMTDMTNNVTALSRDQVLDHRAIATLQDRQH